MAIGNQSSMYGFGLGGAAPWSFKRVQVGGGPVRTVPVLNPNLFITPESPSRGPQDIRRKAPRVVPVGSSFKQEQRSLMQGLERGVDVIEAPERFVRGKGTSDGDKREQYYSTVTGKPMGTVMGTGSYGGFGRGENTTQRGWSNYVGDNPIERKKYSGYYEDSLRWNPNARPQLPFSPPQNASSSGMFREALGRVTGFGGIPRFPFAGQY